MSWLPEAGEARAAAEAMDARLRAASADTDVRVAEVNANTGEIRGEGEFSVRSVYGDLFDVGEVAALGEGPVQAFLVDIAMGVPPDAALRSMFFLAVATGVLMERARWEKER